MVLRDEAHRRGQLDRPAPYHRVGVHGEGWPGRPDCPGSRHEQAPAQLIHHLRLQAVAGEAQNALDVVLGPCKEAVDE